MNYGFYNSGMGSLEKTITIRAIRAAAIEMVGDCTDFQIMFCAAAVHRISESKPTLEDLSDKDIKDLYYWIITEESRASYGD